MKCRNAILFCERGSVLVMAVIALPIVLGFATLAIDTGNAWKLKSELQNGADAAALAGARVLGQAFEKQSSNYIAGALTSDALKNVQNAAIETGGRNKATGNDISIKVANITIGSYDRTAGKFNETTTGANAVRVNLSGSVNSLFGSLFGTEKFDINVTATAALTPVQLSKLKPGLPFAIGAAALNPQCNPCVNTSIEWNGSNKNCVGWTTYKTSPSSTPNVIDVIQCLIDKELDCDKIPALSTADQYDTDNGTKTPAFNKMSELFDKMKKKNDGKIDLDNSDSTWTTVVAVLDIPPQNNKPCECNTNQKYPVKGYATITVNSINNGVVDAYYKCNGTNVIYNDGGGNDNAYGNVLSVAPSLLE